MPVELEKIDRYSFPSGLLDFTLRSDGELLYAACMDGIYELSLLSLSPEPSAANEADKDKKDKPKEKAKPHRIGRHGSYVSSVALIESTHSLLSASYDGTFHVRDLSANGKVPAVSESNENVAKDETKELEPRVSERIHAFWSWDMALSPDQRLVASVSGQYLAGAETIRHKRQLNQM